MPSFQTLVLFYLAALPLHLTPGPGMLYIAARSTSEGRAAGLMSILGIALGTLIHSLLLALGLSALLSSVPLAYEIVRLLGIGYLMFLGVRAIIYPPTLIKEPETQSAQLRNTFIQGVVTNILNPKVALFLLAFLPQFVDPTQGNAFLQILILGLFFELSAAPVNIAVILGSSTLAAWLKSHRKFPSKMSRLAGAVYIYLGLRLAFSERR